jgi:hypothetical protein
VFLLTKLNDLCRSRSPLQISHTSQGASLVPAVGWIQLLRSGRASERKPGVKLREKGKKESQVFTSVADNPRQGAIAIPSLRRVWRYSVSSEVARW